MRTLALSLCLLWLAACGSSPDDNPAEDMAATPDLPADMAADLADMPQDPCAAAQCGASGRCEVMAGQARCVCGPDEVAVGLTCAPVGEGLRLTSLPATVSAALGEQAEHQLTTNAAADARVGYTIVNNACPFPVVVDADTGLVRWTCPQTPATCAVSLRAEADGGSNLGELTVVCEAPAVRLGDDAPRAALEGAEYVWEVSCEARDGGEVLLEVGAADTCGGRLEDGRYTFVPSVAQAQQTCVIDVSCARGEEVASLRPEVFVRDAAARVAVGPAHTCAIRGEGLWCWGMNTSGQLGRGGKAEPASLRPAPVVGMEQGASAVAVGDHHTCAIKDGALYCWGSNGASQLGDTSRDTVAPRAVAGMAADVSAVAASSELTCAIKAGALYCWGRGDRRFGDDSPAAGDTRRTPTLIPTMDQGVSAVAMSRSHTCAIKAGALWCWGRNVEGEQGTGSVTPQIAPRVVAGMESEVSAVTAGANDVCAVKAGQVWCWGRDRSGIFAASADGMIHTPSQLGGFPGAAARASLGGGLCAVMAADRALWCLGANFYGELGDNTMQARLTPALTTLGAAPVVGVAGYNRGRCAVMASGEVYCWGYNYEGRLGVQGDENQRAPVAVSSPLRFEQVSVGYKHTCGVAQGQVYCWGEDSEEQLGDGQVNAQFNPIVLARTSPSAVSGMDQVSAVATSDAHTCALRLGEVWCWGSNLRGQLGQPAGPPSPSPVRVPGLDQVSAITAAGGHTCALRLGEVRCWGVNIHGQLGVGDRVVRDTPTLVGLGAGVTALTSGLSHTCAIQGGGLYCWGLTPLLGINDPSIIERTLPVSVPGMEQGVSAVAANDNHTCAIKDGALYCWGNNSSGQLGDATTQARIVATPVVRMGSGVTAVGLTATSTCAVQAGEVYCWGSNNVGQLGGATLGDTPAPVKLPIQPAASPLRSLDGGKSHVCWVEADGLARCWGSNERGQLGSGLFYETAPRLVSL